MADLIAADARQYEEELAAEGYRLLSGDTAQFAEAAWPLAGETWPTWKVVKEKPGAMFWAKE